MKSALSFFLLFFLAFAVAAPQTSKFLPVSKVVDGDTFWVKHPDGREEKIRLIGVDSPESRRTGRKEVEYFGKESSDFANRMLSGKKVRLEYDVQRYDRYQRTLAYVYLEDGTFFNALMVREGFATVATFPPNVRYESLFHQEQQKARSMKKGLWAK